MAKKDPFLALAAKYEPKIRRALLSAWASMRNEMTLKEAEAYLITGGPELLLSKFDEIALKYGGDAADEVAEAWKAGGEMSMSLLPPEAIVNPAYKFNMYNTNNIEFLNKYRFELINTISSNTREGLRQGLITDTMAGKNPLVTARNFKNTIGLTPRQEAAVSRYSANLANLNRDALKRALRDKRFDRTVLAAIESGEPLTDAQISKLTNRYRERYIQYRAQVIARTESLRAISIGNHQSLKQMIETNSIDPNRVSRFWKYNHDGKTRPGHVAIPGLNPKGVGIDEPFKTPGGPLMYPLDPNGSASNTVQCRCSVRYKLREVPELREEPLTINPISGVSI